MPSWTDLSCYWADYYWVIAAPVTICTTVRSETCSSSDRTTSNLSPSPNWITTLSSGLKTGFLESLLCRFVLFPHSAPGRDQIGFFFISKLICTFQRKFFWGYSSDSIFRGETHFRQGKGALEPLNQDKHIWKWCSHPFQRRLVSSVSRAPALNCSILMSQAEQALENTAVVWVWHILERESRGSHSSLLLLTWGPTAGHWTSLCISFSSIH